MQGIVTRFYLIVFSFCMASVVGAQTQQPRQISIIQAMATLENIPAPQLEFVGKEDYEVNGAKSIRYKLSVTNRASHPDFLWLPSPNLPACGKNKNAARTWVEVFGSPGGRRLSGFCAIRASEDLGRLWFPPPSAEKAPACVYIVMTDRQTGKKYNSNRVCSRSFTTGTSPRGSKNQIAGGNDSIWMVMDNVVMVFDRGTRSKEPGAGMVEIQAEREKEKSESRYHTVTGRITSVAADPTDSNDSGKGNITSGQPAPNPLVRQPPSVTQKSAGGRTAESSNPPNIKLAQPDLIIKQFLFPPTNDKALRVHVANQGNAASGACRLIMTIRKINGAAVGRQTHVNIPALAPGKTVWLVIDAKSILPVNVSLKSTTFKLNADATGIVAESDETNNEVWHNL